MEKRKIWNFILALPAEGKRLLIFLKQFPWLQEAFVFLLFLLIYLPFQSGISFADPDAFYHLKISELIWTNGIIRSFDWLPFSTLAGSYADHHFIYHLALIPFIKIFGSLSGLKIATGVFSALAVATLAWALRRLNVQYPIVWAILAGIMNPFAFRIGLAKASAPGVILLIIGLVLALQRRALLLGMVSFIYVWTHGGWPALLGLGTIALCIVSWPEKKVGVEKESRLIPFLKAVLSPLLALWGGALAGLVINPFFPQNLKFYWEQIIQIAVVNYQNVIGVGNEWYPYGFGALGTDLPLMFILGALVIVIFPIIITRDLDEKQKQHSRIIISLSVAALIFLMMTLRSRRHVEYFVPLAVMAIASWIGEIKIKDLGKMLRSNIIISVLIISGLVSMTAIYGIRSLTRVQNDLKGSYKYTVYQKATQYLIANTEQDEVIVHADWDQMPSLFYWDHKNRYIMGLDPTFTYNANHDRYWRYVNFTLGKSTDPLGVMTELKARFVLSDLKHPAFNKALDSSNLFEVVYTDSDAIIYKLK